jgi:hypothetical protein
MHVFAWIVKEVIAFPLWILAVVGRTVEWRGSLYILNADSTVREWNNKK